MSDPTRAVFLSYASQDGEAARRICDALRSVGIEVWFDQSELRGGDAWDASIRRQIKNCHLFLPIISVNTQAREEGYFRREWHLAIDRTLDLAQDRTFLLPVVIDDTLEAEARVPERLREVQWTRLPNGEPSAAFIERVQRLMSPAAPSTAASPLHMNAAATGSGESGAQPAATQRPSGRRPVKWLKLGIPTLMLVLAVFFFILPWQRREHARNVLLPAIQERASKNAYSDGQLFDMTLEAEKYLPNDPALKRLWPAIAMRISIDTEPAGAEVFWKDYATPSAEWRSAGLTPIKGVRVASDHLRFEIRKRGFQTIELAGPRWESFAYVGGAVDTYVLPRLRLDPLRSLPGNMVRIPGSTNDMYVVGLEKYHSKLVPEFLVDKFEVTNRQFKDFVDAGGYTNTAYWRFPIEEAGKMIPLAIALAKFKDRTGRPGPATWEAGSYPDGTGDHPVTGVSWYEAAAYAEYARKQLPTAYHWAQIADTFRTEFLIPFSNFNGKSTTAVGSLASLSSYGVYDVAGNAREWVFNSTGNSGERFILGGGWSDPAYAFIDAYWQPALDRSVTNGFRCIRELSDSSSTAALRQPMAEDFRDYAKEVPVDDKTFATFLRQFAYDKKALDARIDKVIESDNWKAEVVSINTGYNNERMQLYVYLPLHATKPLQPVILFPGSDAIQQSHYDVKGINNWFDFVVKSGRALILPIYKGTFERHDELKSDLVDESVAYKDHTIMWVKDFGRTIDYLESRKDMRADAVAYLGFSWGGFMGGILPAVEKRIRVVVLYVGGMAMQRALPEVDQINYVPRVTQPVLMLNGKYDVFFPLKTAQEPLFKLLGTPKSQKKMVVYPYGHLLPQVEFMKETLAWLDTNLGPVQ